MAWIKLKGNDAGVVEREDVTVNAQDIVFQR